MSASRDWDAATYDRISDIQLQWALEQLDRLELPEPVDAAFSNATFHWVHDHDQLFARLYAATKPGGQLMAQCGGRGNIDSFRVLADAVAATDEFKRYFADWQRPWNYAGADETRERLERAGFIDVECWLEPRPVTPEDPRAFVQTVCLVRHLDPLPEEIRPQFIDRVLEQAGDPLVLEYVRLNMTARRSAVS